jgi:hypothetical protein
VRVRFFAFLDSLNGLEQRDPYLEASQGLLRPTTTHMATAGSSPTLSTR